MKKLSFLCFTLSFLLAPLLFIQLSGCATMNQAECSNADWYMIGLEDGSAGRDLSYIGNHRTACSEYGVVPDLDRYKQGRTEGLTRFCTQQNGYQQGLRGSSLSSVCPRPLAAAFQAGYRQGHKLYQVRADIAGLNRQLKQGEGRLKWLEDTIARNEQMIISSSTTENARRQLLSDNKDFNLELESLRESLPLMRRDLDDLYAMEARLRRQ